MFPVLATASAAAHAVDWSLVGRATLNVIGAVAGAVVGAIFG